MDHDPIPQTPESPKRQREKAVYQLFTNGLKPQEYVGLHGTSIHSLRVLINTGFFPGTTETPETKGEVFFNPNTSTFRPVDPDNRSIVAELMRSKFPLVEEVEDYTTQIAKAHRFAEVCGLDFTNADDMWAARTVAAFGEDPHNDYDEMYAYLLQKGYSRENIEDAKLDAQEYQGVILGLSTRIMNYPIEHHSHFVVQPGTQGLIIADFSGAEARGPKEREFFESLK